MILFFERGQLGNQLFQYCAIRKYQPVGTVISIGLNELKTGFTGVDLSRSRWWERLLERIVRRIGQQRIDSAARKLRILTLVEEDFSEAEVTLKITPGLLRDVAYFKAGFFQGEKIASNFSSLGISIKPEITNLAEKVMDSLPCQPTERFFVHVRRGDYVKWPSAEEPAVLPLTWYKDQIERIRSSFPNAFFIIVSDDRPYVDEFFGGLARSYISRCDMWTDFALMAKCQGGGILSASTFAWWAANFARQESPRARFIAPLYWGGLRKGDWYPPKIKTSWLEYHPLK